MPSTHTPSARGARATLDRLFAGLFARILLGVVTVSIALAVALALVLTDSASSSLRSQARSAKAAAATAVARGVDGWASERRLDASGLAGQLGAAPDARRLHELLPRFSALAGAWVYGPDGARRLGAGRAPAPAAVSRAGWFARATPDAATLSPLSVRGAEGLVYAAVRLPSTSGRESTLVAAIPTRGLQAFVQGTSPGRTGEALLVASDHLLVTSTRGGETPLRAHVASAAATRALAGAGGALVYRDYRGHEVVGGYAPASQLGWAVIVKQDTSVAFAAIHHQRTLALVLILAGFVAILIVALLLARILTAPLVELQRTMSTVSGGDLSARVDPRGAAETRRLGHAFNAMVANLESLLGAVRGAGEEMTSSSAELSAAAEQLASATSEQSSASTETSSTMEELARTSSTIAEHADGVAERCVETRDALREAEQGMRASSERTMALAGQVDEISTILELINSIADKTAVLSLNAAIEAARAGESGAGFTVVSEEVGRLAERSKASAAHIAEIVKATQRDATATVMAMEAGGQQMRRGLELMEEVTTAANQVQLTTQQQRTATVQVVDTMSSLSESTRQTSATTQQIAESAANLSGLAGDLRRAAAQARGRDAAREPEASHDLAPPTDVDREPPMPEHRSRPEELDRVLVGAGGGQSNGHRGG